ncbi:MAG: hypothetical protein NZM18_08380 [Thermoflexales bacterium]|nr:hypothetical protein [Thermoflexales bacterium]
MAIILPDTPLTTSPEVARIHRLLKQLPDETYTVWHRLAIHAEPGPDFWVLHRDRRALWIKVSALTPIGAEVFTQPGLFEAPASRPAEAEHRALMQFARANFSTAKTQPLQRIPAVVAFPNLAEAELARLAEKAEIPPGITWLGKECLALNAFTSWLEQHLTVSLTEDDITHLREAFTPEVVIPAQFTVRTPPARAIPESRLRYTAAASTPFLLDYDQERALKTELALSDEARAAINDFTLRLVNGVAGSGKSLILIYRAQLLRRLFPQKSILGLTHNRPLIHDLRARYLALNPESRPVKWQTFYQWCRSLWPKDEPWREPIGQGLREQIIANVWHAHLADTAISERLLLDELDWCKDRLIFSRDEYLAADRTGRGFALSEAQRDRMYTAFEAYQAELNRRGRMDWGDVPRQLWRWVQAGRLQLPQYDVILVDEAQFFAPLWFELIKRAVKLRTGHLFLAADPTQGFLKRRQSWLASGLDVRGRVHRLKKSYRTTREILDFATLLYRARVPDEDDDIETPDLLDMPKGVLPQIIPLTSAQDEITRVANEIEQLVRQGVPKRHLLVIHTDWRGQERLLERLRFRLGASAAVDPKKSAADDAIRVCTLNAAAGLESPIVFLVGAHQLFEQEHSVRLSDEERAELIRDNTRKLYMALTRAGQRVMMTYVGPLPDVLASRLPGFQTGRTSDPA